MRLLRHLGGALLDPSQEQTLVRRAETLLRRSLRLPHLRFEQDKFPPCAIAICVFAYLSQLPIQSVYNACAPEMLTDDTTTTSMKDFDIVKRVWEEGWQPAVPQLQVDAVEPQTEANEAVTQPCKGFFNEYFIFLAPSLFFTNRLATFLLTKVRENGGDGKIVSSGDKGLEEVSMELNDSEQKANQLVLCTDAAVIKRMSHAFHILCLPHKWLSDSLRDERIKSAGAYLQNFPAHPPTSPVTPATPKKRNTPEDDFDSHDKRLVNMFSFKKRKNEDVQAMETNTSKSAHVTKKLFQTPTQKKKPSRVLTGHQVPQTRKVKWACEVRTSFNDSPFPMNDKVCELLGVVQDFYAVKKDHFRAIGYQKAIAKIRSLDYELLTDGDAQRAGSESTIGAKIKRKIVEIVKTGRLLQAEAVLENSDNNTVKAFCDIWGVGPVKAMHLVSQGIKSIQQLRQELKKRPYLLDKNQKIGLRLYEDLLHRIPREEVADLEMYVRKEVKSVDSTLDITVAGSYLRGKSSCGDVDIMIHGNAENVRNGFPKVQSLMKASGVLTDDLVAGPDKYFGVFRFPGRRHGRVDLFAVPKEQFPYALLTYTGSAIFNRSMRAKARTLGYSLSHTGLQRVCRTRHSKARLEPSILVRDEKEIFLLLDIPYVPPEARSIS